MTNPGSTRTSRRIANTKAIQDKENDDITNASQPPATTRKMKRRPAKKTFYFNKTKNRQTVGKRKSAPIASSTLPTPLPTASVPLPVVTPAIPPAAAALILMATMNDNNQDQLSSDLESLPSALPTPLPLEGNPELARRHSDAEDGQRLTVQELRAVAYVVVHKQSIGEIYTKKSKGGKLEVIVNAPLSCVAPVGGSLNHAAA